MSEGRVLYTKANSVASVVFDRPGCPEVLELREVPDPSPAAGDPIAADDECASRCSAAPAAPSSREPTFSNSPPLPAAKTARL